MSPKILVVDDDATVRRPISRFLERAGFGVAEAATAQQAGAAFLSEHPDAVVLDHVLPDGDSLTLLAKFKAQRPSVPIFILTGHGSIDLAVRAVKEGAEDFLTKPLRLGKLAHILKQALLQAPGHSVLASADAPVPAAPDPFLGTSAGIQALKKEAEVATRSNISVLITGPTGSGKGVLARYLHDHGPRADERFVALNCSSLTSDLLRSELFGHVKGAFTGADREKKGLFDIANNGTLFLDEIGDLDREVQPRLLTALEEKTFRRLGGLKLQRSDARLLSATQRDLPALSNTADFRADLYYRIATIVLKVPALVDRKEDLPALAAVILEDIAAGLGVPEPTLSQASLAQLVTHDWPGNIRQLRNTLERATIACSGTVIECDDLRIEALARHDTPSATATDPTLAELQQQEIKRVLQSQRGHVSRAARQLGIPRSTFYERLKAFDIRPKDYRG